MVGLTFFTWLKLDVTNPSGFIFKNHLDGKESKTMWVDGERFAWKRVARMCVCARERGCERLVTAAFSLM